MSKAVPVVAILAPNSLMGLGLRAMLEKMFPFALFQVCEAFSEIEASDPEDHFHIFVMANIVVEHSEFFEARHSKTIVLTSGTPYARLLEGYPQINISASQEQIIMSLEQLHGAAHGSRPLYNIGMEGRQDRDEVSKESLTPREVEVLQLLVEGLLNKEIASRLNIGLTTVISHRKNIVEKLGVKSLAGLTIYAVMKRYVVL